MHVFRKSAGFILIPALIFCGAVESRQIASNSPQIGASVQAQAKNLALSEAIPTDSQITIGRFPNGMRYYIRENKLPLNRAELRLVVNAGSVLEDNDQLGLAHMLEHMSFNGTKNFAKQQIVGFMESIGMRFGPSLNAYTSFDETAYMLTIPTDKPEVMDKAFLILEDWAQNLSLDPKEIDKERGVIVEEWRQGRGADARMQDKVFPILFKGSRYADRLPIGKMDVIEKFKHDALKRFYKDWYRPDLMAVIAVGDFDKSAVEVLIRNHFGSLPATKVPRLRPTYNVPDHPATEYAIATDKEATLSSVAIYNKLPLREQGSVGVYRQEIVNRLAGSMLSRRLSELVMKPDAPFIAAGAAWSIFVRTKEAAFLNAIAKEGAIERALEVLLTEATKAAKFGFTPTELEREKVQSLRAIERYFVEKDKRESASLAAELIRNFTQKETLPSPEMEYALNLRFLPEITVDEVNEFAKNWLNEASRVIVVNTPEKAGVAVPDQAKLAAVVRSAGAKELVAYVDTVASQALLDKLPEPGKIASESAKPDFGITEWQLSNGVKVVLKPTNLKQDEIVFRATSPGGYQLADDQDFLPARTAAQVMSAAGVGKFSMIDLRKVLSGKIASVMPVISEIDEGLTGNCSAKDLETMFQLIYLRFMEPRSDPNAFAAQLAQLKVMLANQQMSPEWAFSEMLQKALTQDHPRARPMTTEILDQMNLEKSLAFYRDRFADASDFTFVFVGSFSPEALRPLAERYLASLPALYRKETWKDAGIRPPKGVIEKTIRKGVEPKSSAAIVFTGPFQYDPEHRVTIRAMGMVLDTRLREVLREELSGTYGAGVGPSYSKAPIESYAFTIQFGCNPQRTEELVKAVFREIEALKKNGPTEKQVGDIREQLTREFETNTQNNAYLLSQIYLRYEFGEDLGKFFGLRDYYKTINAKMIQDAAITYLNLDNYVKVLLFPDAGKETKPEEQLEVAS